MVRLTLTRIHTLVGAAAIIAAAVAVDGKGRSVNAAALGPDVAPQSGAAGSIVHPDIVLPVPDDETRVTAGAVISPAVAARGGTVVLFVKMRVAAHHWIYALDNSGSRSVPTTLQVLTNDIRPAGEWNTPEPKSKDGSRTLSGDILFYRPFVIDMRVRSGELHVPVKVKYQMCNESLCWPATTISLEAVVKVGNR